jgi:hypothetical protein
LSLADTNGGRSRQLQHSSVGIPGEVSVKQPKHFASPSGIGLSSTVFADSSLMQPISGPPLSFDPNILASSAILDNNSFSVVSHDHSPIQDTNSWDRDTTYEKSSMHVPRLSRRELLRLIRHRTSTNPRKEVHEQGSIPSLNPYARFHEHDQAPSGNDLIYKSRLRTRMRHRDDSSLYSGLGDSIGGNDSVGRAPGQVEMHSPARRRGPSTKEIFDIGAEEELAFFGNLFDDYYEQGRQLLRRQEGQNSFYPGSSSIISFDQPPVGSFPRDSSSILSLNRRSVGPGSILEEDRVRDENINEQYLYTNKNRSKYPMLVPS